MQCNAHAIANAKRISDAMFLDGGERRQFKDPGEIDESGGFLNVCAEGANNSCENHPLRSAPSLQFFDSKICFYNPSIGPPPLEGVGYTGKRLSTTTHYNAHPLQHLEAY